MYDNIVLIPYRDREYHLNYFIKTLPLFKEHLPNSKVVVIEQNKGKLFNRGKILNVGFNEYKNCEYYITHDIDIIPDKQIICNIYNMKKDIISIWNPHKFSLGGIIKIKKDIIYDINGFPNYIWGWGIEDRALYFRSIIKNYNIYVNNNKLNFTYLNHKSNVEKYKNDKLKISNIWSENNINSLNELQQNELIMNSGLNNLEYKILKKSNINNDKYIDHIIVDI
tara:strand:+ start:104 stop:775 length:672 start_codon:yes stop_codon:yes gene_type:complete